MNHETSEKRLKVGFAGCGAIARNKSMPALQKLESVELAAFFDIDPQKAAAARQIYGGAAAKVYGSYPELLGDRSIDVLYVCTPNRWHAEMSIDALLAGKHVMCEKPMAITARDAAKMMEAAKKTGKKLSVAYQNRFRPDSLFLHNLCAKGELGEIYYAKAYAVRRRAVPTWGAFLDRATQGGGPLIDIGSHALDLVLWMMDNYQPKYVVGKTYDKIGRAGSGANAWGAWDPERFQVEDAAFAFIGMQNGATVALESSWALNVAAEKEAKITLCGTKGGADMENGLRLNGERDRELFTTTVETGFHKERPGYGNTAKTPADLEAESWIDHVLHDQVLIVRPEQALVVTAIIEAVYESAQSGQPVFFA